MPGNRLSTYGYDDTTAPNKGIGQRTAMTTYAQPEATRPMCAGSTMRAGAPRLAGQAIAGALRPRI